MSPSLRGSGLKFESVKCCFTHLKASPSLRGSGLKSALIRMQKVTLLCLPLYEGVDWNYILWFRLTSYRRSPSLRGSGLKYAPLQRGATRRCLPLYEGVDWNSFFFCCRWATKKSPSLRGSGLKSFYRPVTDTSGNVSLFTREWIEMSSIVPSVVEMDNVSLFTREWIEIRY